MSLFLFRFWPVVIPLVVYWLWLETARRKARKTGAPVPLFRDGPWYWIIFSTLSIAVLCFLFLASGLHENKGNYVPPHMEGGKLLPGHVE